eukprot:10307780-Alexandrium_andersonii.AAC.1
MFNCIRGFKWIPEHSVLDSAPNLNVATLHVHPSGRRAAPPGAGGGRFREGPGSLRHDRARLLHGPAGPPDRELGGGAPLRLLGQ